MGFINSAYALEIDSSNWPFAANLNFASLGALVSFFLPKLLLLAGIIFFLLTIYAGFTFLSSAGSDDAHALEKWRLVLTSGVIGLIIVLSAYLVLQIINYVTAGAFNDLL